MKKSIQITTLIYLGFALFLGASGMMLSYGYPTLSTITSYFGFALPLIAFAIYVRRRGGEVKIPLIDDKEGLFLSIPFAFISLIGVMGISFLTSLLLNSLGKGEAELLSGNIVYLISRYAFLPAFLEELLFRLVPLCLIAPYSKKSAIVLSSIMFAVVHCDMFEIPYALFAGVLYMFVDIMAGSVLPSIIIHLVNNVVAVLWQVYFIPLGLTAYALAVIGALAIISALAVILAFKRYKPYFKAVLDRGDRVTVDNASLIFIIFFSAVSIFSIF